VDPFVAVMVGIFVLLVVGVLLLGVFYPGSGAEQLDWKPTRSAELEYQNEIDDLEQMTEAVNARRRARGAEELTEAGLRAEVAEEARRIVESREGGVVEQDIAELLEATNARRAQRGLPPLTREDVERDVMGG
jgi:hypothetical protein